MQQQIDWSPDEIKAQNFRGSLFGFSRGEVKDFLRLLSKVWSRMQDHQKDLGIQILKLEKEIQAWHAREDSLIQREANAKVEAERIIHEAQEKCEVIRQRTEGWLEEVISKVEETQRQKKNFLTAFRSSLDSHYELIKAEEEENEPLSSKLADVLKTRETHDPRISQ